MRDVLNWWRGRGSQLLVLFTFALLLIWQNWQARLADRHFRRLVTEVRESLRQQDIARDLEFARLLKRLESRFSRIDEALAPEDPAPPASDSASASASALRMTRKSDQM